MCVYVRACVCWWGFCLKCLMMGLAFISPSVLHLIPVLFPIIMRFLVVVKSRFKPTDFSSVTVSVELPLPLPKKKKRKKKTGLGPKVPHFALNAPKHTTCGEGKGKREANTPSKSTHVHKTGGTVHAELFVKKRTYPALHLSGRGCLLRENTSRIGVAYPHSHFWGFLKFSIPTELKSCRLPQQRVSWV